jgi:hypothetical protein
MHERDHWKHEAFVFERQAQIEREENQVQCSKCGVERSEKR